MDPQSFYIIDKNSSIDTEKSDSIFEMSNAITKQILLKVEETEKEIEGNFQQVSQIM